MAQLDIYSFLHQVGNFIPAYVISYIVLTGWIIPKIYRALAYRRLILKGLMGGVLVSLGERNILQGSQGVVIVYKIEIMKEMQIFIYSLMQWYTQIKRTGE
jgi:hypothetical protein